MPINDLDKQQIRNTILKMEANDESKNSIQYAVNKMKSKFEPEEKTGLLKTIRGGLGKAKEEVSEFVGGAVRHPIQTGVALTKGVGTAAIDVIGRPISKGLAKAIPGEDVFERAVKREKSQVAAGKGRFEFQQKGELGKRAGKVGEFATKAGLGAALVAGTGGVGTGLGGVLTSGAIANVPFIPDAFEEGGLKGAAADIVLNTAIDATTLGVSKAFPIVKKAISKQVKLAGKKLTNTTVDKMTRAAMKAAKKAIKAPKKKLGEGVVGVGKSFVESGAKFTKPFTKHAGRSHKEGTQKFLDDIVKYNLESPLTGFDGSSKKAQKLINSKMNESKNILSNFNKNNPDVKIDVDEVALRLIDDLENGLVKDMPSRDIKRARKVVFEELEEIAEFNKLSGELNVISANKMKQEVSKNLFKKGAPNISEDPAQKKILELLSLRIRDEIGEVVPAHKVLGREVHELINVRGALDDAAQRIGKNNKLDIPSLIAGASTVPAYAINPNLAVGIGAGILGRKILGGGRGASAIIKAGKGIAKAPLEGAVIGAGIGAATAPEGERLKGAGIGAGIGAAGQKGLKGLAKNKLLKNQRGSVEAFQKTQQKTPAFKKWFGDWEKTPKKASKVVDRSGKPLVVYHGTDETFDIFDKTKRGKRFGDSASKEGFFFISNKNIAENAGDNVVEAFVSAKKPKIVNAEKLIKEEYRILKKKGEYSGTYEGFVDDFIDGDPYTFYEQGQLFDDIIAAKKTGNDALIVDFGDLEDVDFGSVGKLVVPFEPNQIKSATGNTGKFNPDDPKIKGSALSPMLPATALTGLAGLTAGGILSKKKKGKE